jgi:hypothetical protein
MKTHDHKTGLWADPEFLALDPKGWTVIGEASDINADDEDFRSPRCGLCHIGHMRWAHPLHHPDYPEVVYAAASCTDDLLARGGKTRSHKNEKGVVQYGHGEKAEFCTCKYCRRRREDEEQRRAWVEEQERRAAEEEQRRKAAEEWRQKAAESQRAADEAWAARQRATAEQERRIAEAAEERARLKITDDRARYHEHVSEWDAAFGKPPTFEQFLEAEREQKKQEERQRIKAAEEQLLYALQREEERIKREAERAETARKIGAPDDATLRSMGWVPTSDPRKAGNAWRDIAPCNLCPEGGRVNVFSRKGSWGVGISESGGTRTYWPNTYATAADAYAAVEGWLRMAVI